MDSRFHGNDILSSVSILISFEELTNLLLRLGFQQRISGSHHIFSKEKVEEILNLQPSKEGKAKPYQVRQVRELLVKYKLVESLKADDEDEQNE